ncbi:hypothetical protein ACFQX7_22540 [Luedemannella flava]
MGQRAHERLADAGRAARGDALASGFSGAARVGAVVRVGVADGVAVGGALGLAVGPVVGDGAPSSGARWSAAPRSGRSRRVARRW